MYVFFLGLGFSVDIFELSLPIPVALNQHHIIGWNLADD